MTANIDLSDCPTPFWLPGGHLQTIYSAYLAKQQPIAFVRKRLDTPDGDFLDLDFSGPGLFADTLASGVKVPTEPQLSKTAAKRWMQTEDVENLKQIPSINAMVLFHGLEGSSYSHYAQASAQYFRARGWLVVIAHFRGCSGFANRMARAYYSGDSEEIAFILNRLRTFLPQMSWHAVGVSLGGNALLKYLGEAAEKANWLQAAAAISVPMDLVSCGEHLSDSLAGKYIYSPHFLKSMKSKTFEKSRRFPGMIDTLGLGQVKTLRDFDDIYTAPMHGYRDALHYWTKASSRSLLKKITLPTLVLNAKNDPFVPKNSLPQPQHVSESVLLHQPKKGGHVGFTTGIFPGNLDWLPRRINTFFKTKK